uniref:Uncharacterized protein n=1 Tax=Anguilla anguilla TaxID=7936 RepID=A0A0E9SSP9_ANGAN
MQSVVQVRVWEERITVFEFRIGSYVFLMLLNWLMKPQTDFLEELNSCLRPPPKKKKVLHKNMNRATKFTKVSGETLEAL